MRVDYAAPMLIVDDEQIMVHLTRQVLSKVGFEHIGHSSDGATAFRLLRELKHKLVIADLRMQPMEACRSFVPFARTIAWSTTRVLLMTASLAPEPVVAAEICGSGRLPAQTIHAPAAAGQGLQGFPMTLAL